MSGGSKRGRGGGLAGKQDLSGQKFSGPLDPWLSRLLTGSGQPLEVWKRGGTHGLRPVSLCSPSTEAGLQGEMAAKQPPPLMKKHSQTDLVSRLKTRKILGVGGEDDDGEVHRSKVGHIRGPLPARLGRQEELRPIHLQEPQDLAHFSRNLMEMSGE